MRFYWPEGPTEMVMTIGQEVRGITQKINGQKHLRPVSVSFEPPELIQYLNDVGVVDFQRYLYNCNAALRR